MAAAAVPRAAASSMSSSFFELFSCPSCHQSGMTMLALNLHLDAHEAADRARLSGSRARVSASFVLDDDVDELVEEERTSSALARARRKRPRYSEDGRDDSPMLDDESEVWNESAAKEDEPDEPPPPASPSQPAGTVLHVRSTFDSSHSDVSSSAAQYSDSSPLSPVPSSHSSSSSPVAASSASDPPADSPVSIKREPHESTEDERQQLPVDCAASVTALAPVAPPVVTSGMVEQSSDIVSFAAPSTSSSLSSPGAASLSPPSPGQWSYREIAVKSRSSLQRFFHPMRRQHHGNWDKMHNNFMSFCRSLHIARTEFAWTEWCDHNVIHKLHGDERRAFRERVKQQYLQQERRQQDEMQRRQLQQIDQQSAVIAALQRQLDDQKQRLADESRANAAEFVRAAEEIARAAQLRATSAQDEAKAAQSAAQQLTAQHAQQLQQWQTERDGLITDKARSERSLEAERAKVRKLEASREAEQARDCSICYDAAVGVVLNCSHATMCHSCAADLSLCPICRQLITSRTLIRFS